MQVPKINEEKKKQLMRTVGLVVRKHRIEQKKSMYAISAECSVSKTTWREIEVGLNKDLNFSTFWLIAEALDIPQEKLLFEIKEILGEEFNLAGFN